MDWFGRAKIAFTHSPSPLALQRKDGTATDLLKVCEATTPPCQLNPLLFNGDLQTMWTAVKEHGPPIYYRRRIFDADHKTYMGTFTVDFAVDPHQDVEESLPPRTAFFSEDDFAKIGSDDSRPMLFVLHGLSGGSHEIYLRHAIAPLVMDGGNWDVCVVNARGCANSKVTSGVLFNARATWDLRQVVNWARHTFPNRPLFGLGFSLGACILTNVSPLPCVVK
jgi:predicted alpha/beta-fold hydrolase